eukprot:6205376-Pleurochrysis_carterae.AAC.2
MESSTIRQPAETRADIALQALHILCKSSSPERACGVPEGALLPQSHPWCKNACCSPPAARLRLWPWLRGPSGFRSGHAVGRLGEASSCRVAVAVDTSFARGRGRREGWTVTTLVRTGERDSYLGYEGVLSLSFDVV